ncbi:MAG TPA: BON domain-containing protein [Chloroflexaceae bacterium]|nr:BON domain-containing protein [Chloroflexaceae bacterium]
MVWISRTSPSASSLSRSRPTRLLFDAEGRLREIAVRTGRLFGRDIAVPVNQVASFDEGHIRLGLDRAAFERLPEYRDDSLVRRDVERALRDDDLVRRLDLSTIDVAVRGGTVVLRGHARAATSPARAELAARGVPGVRAVVNRIITDDELHFAVVGALGRDERTRAQPLRVYVERGGVVLHGATGGPAACAAAEAVAGSVPGVRAVIPIAAEGRGAGEAPRALFPRVGQEVYTSQTRLGRVERVVLHPRHRRVTALVLQHNQGLIVPVEAVRAVTQAAVLLHADDIAAMPRDDRPFTADAPGPDWQPPYPYTRDEVLLEREHGDAAGACPTRQTSLWAAPLTSARLPNEPC